MTNVSLNNAESHFLYAPTVLGLLKRKLWELK